MLGSWLSSMQSPMLENPHHCGRLAIDACDEFPDFPDSMAITIWDGLLPIDFKKKIQNFFRWVEGNTVFIPIFSRRFSLNWTKNFTLSPMSVSEFIANDCCISVKNFKIFLKSSGLNSKRLNVTVLAFVFFVFCSLFPDCDLFIELLLILSVGFSSTLCDLISCVSTISSINVDTFDGCINKWVFSVGFTIIIWKSDSPFWPDNLLEKMEFFWTIVKFFTSSLSGSMILKKSLYVEKSKEFSFAVTSDRLFAASFKLWTDCAISIHSEYTIRTNTLKTKALWTDNILFGNGARTLNFEAKQEVQCVLRWTTNDWRKLKF